MFEVLPMFEVLTATRDGILIVTHRLTRCAGCGAGHFFFVNNDGQTRCVGCARARSTAASPAGCHKNSATAATGI